MSEAKKITESEFSEIKMLQGKFQELHGRFGNIGLEKMELDRLVTEYVEKEKHLRDEWVSFQKLEQGFLDKLIAVYGEGNLNMADGTFTPTPK